MTFAIFCAQLGVKLESHQRKIARAMTGSEREIGCSLPRGNDKTTTAALLGLHYLLTHPGDSVTIAAASRDQARIAFERMKGFALHPALRDSLLIRHLELRGQDGAVLRVIPADGPRAHGLSSGLAIADEVWGWRDAGLLEALQTMLIKRPDARLLAISTAPATSDSPWGRMRSRALSQAQVTRRGVFTEARGTIHWLEWSAPEDASLDDYKLASKVNPASRFTPAAMREARARVPEASYRQFHLNQLGVTEQGWLPPGAWSACLGSPDFTDGESIWIGLRLGKTGSAVAWINEQRHVGIWTSDRDEGGLLARDTILSLAEDYSVREVAMDLRQSRTIAHELGETLNVVEIPTTDPRMEPASDLLRSSVTERKLVLPDHDALTAAAGRAVAKHSRRGWKVDSDGDITPLLALLLAVDAAGQEQPETIILGWF